MATQVFVFLPPPNVSGLHREAHPYGPTATGFSTDLAIEVDTAVLSNNPALAVVSGLARLIPDPAPATTATVVLKPSPTVLRDLDVVVGGAIVFFIYRNVETTSARPRFEPRIAALENEAFLESDTPSGRVEKFMNGDYAVFVEGGDELVLPSTENSSGGWGHLGFEIAFVPSGLGSSGSGTGGTGAGWDRLKEIIRSTNDATRRRDPMSFYAAVVSASRNVSLAPGHVGHLLLTLPTRRTLLELRDEYDKPFIGTADVTDSSTGARTTYSFTSTNRGTVELATTPSNSTAPSATYTLVQTNHVFTDLPSGSAAASSPAKALTSPAHWALQTIFMADVDDTANWLIANATPTPLPRYTENNRITYILDGIPTFREMVAVMHTITNSNHYLRLAGWWLNDNFALIPGDSTSTFAQLSQTMATAGAQVRALLWDQWGTQNSAEVDHINALPGGNGRAILDNETPNFGSHHQKIMMVNGSGGAVAFCGGVDLNPDRLDDGHHCARSPFHDVHAKVEGPAVGDLNTTFVQRWNAHPSHPPVLSTAVPPFATNPGSQYVQVTRTFAPSFGYPFAPTGDLGTLNTIRRAIQRAQRFIYFDDQYATPYPGSYPYVASQDTVGILTDLLAALAQPSFEYLIILLPNHTDQPQNRYRRHKFIRPLRDAFPDKVHVFYLSRTCPARGPATGSTTAAADLNLLGPAATPGAASQSSSSPSHPNEIYVHAKSWIVDDVYVKIGSCNCNRRGFTQDTEVDIHIVDGALQSGARSFARNYRMDLWGEHLNMSGAARRALLEDPTIALQFWLNPPTGAKISPYDETAELGSGNLDSIWNTFVDPDGR